MNPSTIIKPAVKSAAMLSARTKSPSAAGFRQGGLSSAAIIEDPRRRGTTCYLPTCSDLYASSSTMDSDSDMSSSFQGLSLSSLQEPSAMVGFLPSETQQHSSAEEWGFFVNVDPAGPTASAQQPNTIFQRLLQKEAAALSSSSSSSMGWPSVPL